MQEYYHKKLSPVVGEFIDEVIKVCEVDALIKLSEQVDGKARELDRLINEQVQINKDLKEQQKVNHSKLQLEKIKLDAEIERHKKLSDELKNEISSQASKNAEIAKNFEDSVKRNNEAKVNRSLSVQELTRQQDKTKELQKKIDALKIDSDSLDKKRKEVAEETRLNEIKRETVLADEIRNTAESKRLYELSLDLQVLKKNIELEQKRLKVK